MAAEEINVGTEELIVTHDDEGVATIVLNRPEARNALTPPQMKCLGDVLATLEERPDVRCILVTGAGKAFCAGADFNVLAKGDDSTSATNSDTPRPSPDDQKALQRNVVNRIWNMPIPVIASIPGPAVGAGVGLALACDVRLASDTAVIHSGFARVAASGDMNISFFLTHLVGPAKAKEFLFASDYLSAQEAFEWGLLNRVVPHGELEEAALALARKYAAGPSLAMGMMKHHVHLALRGDAEACLDREIDDMGIAMKSNDHRQGVRALLEKRPPKFTGK